MSKLKDLKQLIQEIEMINKDYSNQIRGLLETIKKVEDENSEFYNSHTLFTRAKIKRLRIYLHEKQIELDKLLQNTSVL